MEFSLGIIKMVKCPDCSAKFLSKSERYRHRRQIHGFVTCTCGRLFLKHEYMQQHLDTIRNHTLGTGKLQCVDCLSRFRRGSQLRRHMNQRGHDGLSGMPIETSKHCNDLYSLQSSELDTFIAEHVQADNQFISCCGVQIDGLVRHLHDMSGKLQPKRVIKAGSLGKGTAVKNRSDIDLVMMLNNYTNVEKLMTELPDLLKELACYLLQYAQLHHRRSTCTRYSVKVEITCSFGHTHDADILPAVDLLELGYTPKEIFQKMKYATKANIHEYSVSLAPLQLEIIKHLPAKVKSLIKLLKYWKNEKLKKSNEAEMPSFADRRNCSRKWPSSYALELVVIGSWNDAGNPDKFEMTHALHAVLKSLVNHNDFRIVLQRQMEYSMDMVDTSEMPYIMDPANPFNDMYHGLVNGQAFDWDKVVEEAKCWLSKPLFSDVNTSKKW